MTLQDHSEDIGQAIIHHVANSDVLFPLFIFGFDISITKHVIMLWIAGVVVITGFLVGSRQYRHERNPVPRGFSNFLEAVVEFIYKDIATPNLGAAHAARWTPFLLTFFTLIFTANILGMIPIFDLIPGSGTATGNFNVTASLAIITFLAIIFAGSREHGIIGHWRNLAPSGVPWPVLFILIPIEILGMFVRPFALTMRLAANMTAGHIAMLSILAPIFLLANPWIGIGSVALNVGISFLEIIVAVVQAYVFTLLSAVFIGAAIHPEH